MKTGGTVKLHTFHFTEGRANFYGSVNCKFIGLVADTESGS
jgi:hypothetical protein